MATHRVNDILFLLCTLYLLAFTASADSNVNISLHHTHTCINEQHFSFCNACTLIFITITSFDVKLINPSFYIDWFQSDENTTNAMQNWLNHGGDLLNRRYAKKETQINPTTVSKLSLKWKFYASKDITATPAIFNGYPLFSKLEWLYLCNQRV